MKRNGALRCQVADSIHTAFTSAGDARACSPLRAQMNVAARCVGLGAPVCPTIGDLKK